MLNFDKVTEHRQFCSIPTAFEEGEQIMCAGAAVGEIEIDTEDGLRFFPICAEHRDKMGLDKPDEI